MITTRQLLGLPPGYHPPPSPPGRRWVKVAIRLGIPLLIVGILLRIKPEIITGTLETTGAMLRVGALLLGWLVFTFLVRRFVPPPALRIGLITVVGLVLLSMTVLPYFIDSRASDTLLTGPAGVSTPESPGPAGAGARDTPDPAGAAPQDSSGPAGAGTRDAPGPASAGPQDSPGPVSAPKQNTAGPSGPSMPNTPGATGGQTPQATAVRVSSGRLKGLAGHRGSGAASIVRTPNGSHVVQLEDYDVSSGITLYLYVVPGANQQRPGTDSVNLGKLTENTGDRVVRIPAGTDLSGPQTVLIWCEPYRTPIAAANQVPA